jgi:hypothetical protein
MWNRKMGAPLTLCFESRIVLQFPKAEVQQLLFHSLVTRNQSVEKSMASCVSGASSMENELLLACVFVMGHLQMKAQPSR